MKIFECLPIQGSLAEGGRLSAVDLLELNSLDQLYKKIVLVQNKSNL
jgi:hypothetical protein